MGRGVAAVFVPLWPTAAALLAILFALTVPAAASSTKPPVISGLSYLHKPLYDDDSLIGVAFTTSRPARRGYEWGVVVSISGKFQNGSCTSLAMSWDRKFGGNPNDHMRSTGKHFRIIYGTRYGYWCRGRGTLLVVEHKIGSDAIGAVNPVAELAFRVLGAP